MQAVEQSIVRQDFAGALRLLDQNEKNSRDRALQLMNRGALLRMAGNYRESNAAFEQAKQRSAELQAVSLREQTAAMSIQEGLKSYVGDDYERVFLHLLTAFNYLDVGDFDNARVEALQLDVELGKLTADGYRDDAFARYLSGLIFDAMNERDDAMIAYRRAFDLYSDKARNFGVPVPASLQADLLRLSEQLGFTEEFEKYRADFGSSVAQPKMAAGFGEVVLLIQVGLAPRKREHSIMVQDGGRLIRISTPHYPPRPVRALSVNVAASGETVSAELSQDIDALARRQLDAGMGAIVARAIARAVVKTKLSQELDKKNGLAGLAVNIAGVITETADTRSWSTLPEKIYVVRLRLPAGEHDISVRFDGGGGIVERTLPHIKVKAGKKVFSSLAWSPSGTR